MKPQPELQPFWTQEQGLDLPAWERAAISFHTPACSSGSSHPFPGAARSFRRAGTHLAWLEGAQDAVCGLGRSPSNQVPPGPLPQEGRPSAGTRNSRGKEPNTSTPGCSGWDPAHSSAVGEAPGSPVGPGWGLAPPAQPSASTQAERWGQSHQWRGCSGRARGLSGLGRKAAPGQGHKAPGPGAP